MKRTAAVIFGLAIGLVGCGSNNSTPTTPSNQPTVFTLQLKPSNEVPAVTNAEAGASGTGVITITTTKDSTGNITSGTIAFNVTMSGFPANSSAIMAHIHGPNATPTSTAGVFVNTGLSPGAAIAMPSGSGSFNLTVTPTVDQINQILANPAGFYFNVHTTVNPGGAIRAELK